MEGSSGASNSRFGNSKTTLMAGDKKLKRIMANKRYHQKYRMRQLSYVAQLEAKEKSLRAEAITTSVMLNCAVHKINLLRIENDSIRQKIDAYSSSIAFREVQCELLLQELHFLQSAMNQQSKSEILVNQHPCTEFTLFAQGATVEATPPVVDSDQNLSQLDIESMMEKQQLCEQNYQEPPINMDMTMMSMIGSEQEENQSRFWVDEDMTAGVGKISDGPILVPLVGMKQTEFYNFLNE